MMSALMLANCALSIYRAMPDSIFLLHKIDMFSTKTRYDINLVERSETYRAFYAYRVALLHIENLVRDLYRCRKLCLRQLHISKI